MLRVVHFEINADQPERAISFYKEVFGWKIEEYKDGGYWLIMTGKKGDVGIDGGLQKRESPKDSTMNYIDVPSVDEFTAKITAKGGSVVKPKMAIPEVGHIAVCKDTEGNTFGIIEWTGKK